jgi:hypothetical protein
MGMDQSLSCSSPEAVVRRLERLIARALTTHKRPIPPMRISR